MDFHWAALYEGNVRCSSSMSFAPIFNRRGAFPSPGPPCPTGATPAAHSWPPPRKPGPTPPRRGPPPPPPPIPGPSLCWASRPPPATSGPEGGTAPRSWLTSPPRQGSKRTLKREKSFDKLFLLDSPRSTWVGLEGGTLAPASSPFPGPSLGRPSPGRSWPEAPARRTREAEKTRGPAEIPKLV